MNYEKNESRQLETWISPNFRISMCIDFHRCYTNANFAVILTQYDNEVNKNATVMRKRHNVY